ncbi:MAG: hypothetical protein KAT15_22880, partial [Bacteroidales bacterium]|nr:hypothetical protein [Bacteroidales bacterium]
MEQLRSNHILILCMVLLALKSPAVSGQRSPFDPEVFLEAFQISEHVEVFTDRSMYTVNEHIHFRAEHVVEGLQEGRSWSTILYVELVASNGTSLVQAKFDLSEQVCSGSLVIPPNTLSGNYFLKCYTRWMRNRGPENFSYTPLKIINPFRSEVSNRTNGGNGVQSICRREYTTGLLECVIPDLPYQRGEDVRVQLSGPV